MYAPTPPPFMSCYCHILELGGLFFTRSYTGGGVGDKVPALISKICIVANNTATATKFGVFS